MTQKTFQAALDRWGIVPQMLMAVEECAELSKSILHFIRGRVPKAEVAGEVADVMIMAQQMRLVFGAEVVDQAMEFKLNRLRERLGLTDDSTPPPASTADLDQRDRALSQPPKPKAGPVCGYCQGTGKITDESHEWTCDCVLDAQPPKAEGIPTEQESEPASVHEPDGCPVEGAVLKREWRRLTAHARDLEARLAEARELRFKTIELQDQIAEEQQREINQLRAQLSERDKALGEAREALKFLRNHTSVNMHQIKAIDAALSRLDAKNPETTDGAGER